MDRSACIACITIGSALSAAAQVPATSPHDVSPFLEVLPAISQVLDDAPPGPAETPVFVDDFSRGSVDSRKWSRQHNASLVEPNVSPRGVRIWGSPAGADWPGELRSVAIDLAGAPAAVLSITAISRSAAADTLAIEYFAADREWRELERALIAASAGPASFVFSIPADGLHAEFAFRCRVRGTPQDTWLIQDAAVRVPRQESDRSLIVDSVPLWGARVRVVPSGKPLIEQSGLTHMAKIVPAGAKVTLIAAAELSGWVFDHWEVQGAAQPSAQRAITLDPGGEYSAVAHFRRQQGGDALTLSVRTSPRVGVRVQIGSGPDAWYDEIASPAGVRLLRGEDATLLAPERTGELVFSHWNVGGRDLPAGETRLQRRYESDTTALAVYLLLGDMNDDDALNRDDVDAFVQALVAPAEYIRQYPLVDRTQRGDVNGDGAFDEQDIESFVDLLLR